MKTIGTTARAALILTSIFCGAATLSGCVTNALYDKEFSNYKDTFSSVLISRDQKTMAILTDKYHYVFKANDKISGILHSSAHKNITATVFTFTLEKANVITGNVELCLPAKADVADIKAVMALGFAQNNAGNYCAFNELKGVRYRAGNLPVADSYKLNKPYEVEVRVTANAWEKGAKIAATPITAAIDGTLIIAGSPFIAGYFIMLANSEAWIH